MSNRTYNVLFLCTGNSARSIFAEAITNARGRGRFIAYSAGSHPTGRVNPYALAELERQGIITEGLRSKDWSEFTLPDSPKMDFVFTVCDRAAAEQCPLWPGQPMTAHWGIPDPAAAEGDELARKAAFYRAYAALHNRISIFIELPIASLDRLKLQSKLEQIGQLTTD